MIPQYEQTIERYRQKSQNEMTSRVFKIDWERNRLTSQHIDGEEAITQTVRVISSVELGDYGIFPDWFGIEMKNMYGMPRPFVKANLERLLKEACNTDERIISIKDFNMEDIEKAVVVRLTVVFKEGEAPVELVIDNV